MQKTRAKFNWKSNGNKACKICKQSNMTQIHHSQIRSKFNEWREIIIFFHQFCSHEFLPSNRRTLTSILDAPATPIPPDSLTKISKDTLSSITEIFRKPKTRTNRFLTLRPPNSLAGISNGSTMFSSWNKSNNIFWVFFRLFFFSFSLSRRKKKLAFTWLFFVSVIFVFYFSHFVCMDVCLCACVYVCVCARLLHLCCVGV